MRNTVVSIIKRSGRELRKMRVCLYDPLGRSADFAMTLLRLVGTVQIITMRTRGYKERFRTAIEEVGAEPVITSGSPETAQFDLLAAPFGINENPHDKCGSPALYIDNIFNKYILTPDCVALPSAFKKGLPPGISECDFAAALYERANVTFLGGNVAEGLVQNGRVCFLKQIFD